MEENGYRFGVGVLVLSSAIIGVLLIAFFGAVPTLWVNRYRVIVNFPNAPKVGVDTQVRKNGVVIGRVANVALLPGDGGVNLTLELDRKHELMMGETPRIGTGSIITGDAVVEFVPPEPNVLLQRFDGTIGGRPPNGILEPDEDAASKMFLTNGAFVRSRAVMPDPIEALIEMQAKLGPVLDSIERTTNRIDAVALAIQDVVGGGTGPVREVMGSVRTTLDNINNAVTTINNIATQVERAEIPKAVADGLGVLPELFKEAQITLAQTQRTLRGFEQFSGSLESIGKEFTGIGPSVKETILHANRAIENIADITVPIKENSGELVEGVISSMTKLDSALLDLKRFAERINSSNGTVARLVDDPELYYGINDTLSSIRTASRNIESITQRLQPIVGDVRVITDKIARDPGVIGVRGALSGRTLGSGIK